MEATTSSSELCDSCIRNTMITDFIKRKGVEAGTLRECVDRSVFTMQHLYECLNCPVCHLILETVYMTPGAAEASQGGRGLVIVSKEEFGRYKVPGSTGLGRRVDRLFVTLMFGIDGFTTRIDGTVFARGIQLRAKTNQDVTKDSYSDLLLGRSMSPNQIDANLIHSWVERCAKWHPETCVPHVFTGHFPMRIIDVQQECIVQTPYRVKFVALSYVWGTLEQREKEGGLGINLTNATEELLFNPGGLDVVKADLPKTITDSMLLCKMLGIDYLWVDALCIRQDDDEDKKVQLPNMHFVYGAAYLTIVAAAGESSWAGLAGVRPNSRIITQHYASIKGIDLVTVARPFLSCVAKCKWSSRGWTYAEKFISTRLLILTEHQMFFHCNKALWYEDAVLEVEDPTFQVDQSQNEDLRSRIGHYKNTPSKIIWERYRHAVLGYTARSLTNTEDCENAFLGITAVLQETFTNGFLWAIPLDVFDYALAWYWSGSSRLDASNRKAPSWSWASMLSSGSGKGARGVSRFATEPSKARRLVFFFRRDPSTQALVPIKSSISSPSTSSLDDLGATSPTYEWKAQGQVRVSSARSETTCSDPEPPVTHRLYLWTRATFLTVDRHRYDSFDERMTTWTNGSRIPKGQNPSPMMKKLRHSDLASPYVRDQGEKLEQYRIRNARGRHVGTIQLDPQWRKSQPDKMEFAALLGYADPKRVLPFIVERRGAYAFRGQLPIEPFLEKDWLETRPVWTSLVLC